MAPPLKGETTEVTGAAHGSEAFDLKPENSATSLKQDLRLSFSHVQLYVDRVEDIETYKDLESSLNHFINLSSKDEPVEEKHDDRGLSRAAGQRKLWQPIIKTRPFSSGDQAFVSQNRDVVKQLIVGLGFRVTGYRFPTEDNKANTRSLLVTSRDSNGVQIIVTARDEATDNVSDDYHHFDAGRLDYLEF